MSGAEVEVTAAPDAATLAAVRDLADRAFRRFTDDDWAHCLGGVHVVVRDGGVVVAHGSVVPRLLWQDGRPHEVGYVECVAVEPTRWRQGLGSTVMTEVERQLASYDAGALSASAAGVPIYQARGWTRWRGTTAVRGDGVDAADLEDQGIWVLDPDGRLDPTGELCCLDRVGDAW